MSRRFLILMATVVCICSGCGDPNATRQGSDETPQAVATRVYEAARALEAQNKTKPAFAAYRQLVSQFPQTPEGSLAAARIRNAQKPAKRKPGVRRHSSLASRPGPFGS